MKIRLFWVPLFAILLTWSVVPTYPKNIILEVLFSLVLWRILFMDFISEYPFLSIHRNYSLTLYTIFIAGTFVSGIFYEFLGFTFISVYIFVSVAMLLFGEKPARAVGLFTSIVLFIHFNEDVWFLLNGLMMTLIASITLKNVYRRIEVLRSAVIMSFFEVLFYSVKFLTLRYFNIVELSVGLLNPFISVVVIVGILPYIEYSSRIYSNIGLMELGNLNHPLLKLLSTRAPGTYQHSTLVANLAEVAAEKIGANSLLARVASYYHDIGKVKRPAFFIENQLEGENPHESISPYLSHLILDEHVKYGVELARKYRLPITLESVIAEHHGTRVQLYFYKKAKLEDPSVSEDDFRYPGPKPRFKESGIIMLADNVEAVIRSFSGKKSPSQIRNIIEETVMGIFVEGQLDDSGLTLQDLEIIIDEFSRWVTSFYHKRIEYPKKDMEVRILNGS